MSMSPNAFVHAALVAMNSEALVAMNSENPTGTIVGLFGTASRAASQLQ
jgi:hypothetical protein